MKWLWLMLNHKSYVPFPNPFSLESMWLYHSNPTLGSGPSYVNHIPTSLSLLCWTWISSFLLAQNLQQRFLVKIFWGLGLKRWAQASFSYFSFSRVARKRKTRKGRTELFKIFMDKQKNWFYYLTKRYQNPKKTLARCEYSLCKGFRLKSWWKICRVAWLLELHDVRYLCFLKTQNFYIPYSIEYDLGLIWLTCPLIVLLFNDAIILCELLTVFYNIQSCIILLRKVDLGTLWE